MKRREFIRGATAAAGLAVCETAGIPVAGSHGAPVNFLLFMSDEHNPRYSSVYRYPGYPDFLQTPNMEALAREGTVYENAYCPSPLCMPCRSSFMSGRRVHEVRAYSNYSIFQPRYNAPGAPEDYSFPSYGQILSRSGVHSVYIGKMDAYASSDRMGFDEVKHPIDRPPPGDWNIRRRPLKVRRGAAAVATQYGPRQDPHAGDHLVVEEACRWLQTSGVELNRQGKPWFLAVNVTAPHFPHVCSEEDWALYPQPGMPPAGREAPTACHPQSVELRTHFQDDHPDWTEENILGNRRGYFARVTFVDRMLGLVMQALAQAGLQGSTVTCYTSDHGEMLGKFGMWRKCALYEDSVCVPLIVSGPGFRRGERVATPVDLLDLQASIFRSLKRDRERPSNWAGEALQDIPVWDGNRAVFSEYHGHGRRTSSFMLRQGDWKLIYHTGAPHQLFNVADDPNELLDLAAREPVRLRRMCAELRSFCSPEEENLRASRFVQQQLAEMARLYPQPDPADPEERP
ncbi:MAG: sulfatase-like hydrolase/transferase [Armatimonadota bacterium]